MEPAVSENELRPLAREVLDAARRAQTPTDAQRERAYQALMAGLGGAATLGTTKAAATAKVAGQAAFAWLKWAVPTAILASAAAGALVWAEHRHAAPPAVHVAAPSAPGTPPALPSSAAADPNAAADASAAPSSSSAATVKPPTVNKAPAGDLGDELTLLHQALAASHAGNAARALELARQHARQYPNSKLRIERDAIEVRSLCLLGRATEAHKIADRLHAQAPNSPVSAALEETCVGQ
jgi:hypothetical protein